MTTSLVPYDCAGVDRQIAMNIGNLRAQGWLTYIGVNALDLMRRLATMRGLDRPKLTVYCERGAGSPAHVYDNFVPLAVVIDGFHADIEVYGSIRGPNPVRLLFERGRLADHSGLYVSYVCVRPHQKLHALEAVRLTPIT